MTASPRVPEAPASHRRLIRRISGSRAEDCADQLAIEEPLEIQVGFGVEELREVKTISITMRTPGHDEELACGFLVGEGLLRSRDQVAKVFGRGPFFRTWQNIVHVALKDGVFPDFKRLQRNCYATSSCGVCGKASLDALDLSQFPRLPAASWRVDERIIRALPERLRDAQEIFLRTGGLHGAGLFSLDGEPIVIREDVGRHNAVDKVIGHQFLAGKGPLTDCILVVSGRASFELMQKALAAGIPMLVAVGAPSSLAAQVAEEYGATLIGFTKPTGFNIYTGHDRIQSHE